MSSKAARVTLVPAAFALVVAACGGAGVSTAAGGPPAAPFEHGRPGIRRAAAASSGRAVRLRAAGTDHARGLRVRRAASGSASTHPVLLRVRAQRTRQQRGLLRLAAEGRSGSRVEPARHRLRDLHRRRRRRESRCTRLAPRSRTSGAPSIGSTSRSIRPARRRRIRTRIVNCPRSTALVRAQQTFERETCGRDNGATGIAASYEQ